MTHNIPTFKLTEPALRAVAALELFCAEPTDAHLEAFNRLIDGDHGLTTPHDRTGFVTALLNRLIDLVKPPAGSDADLVLGATDGTNLLNIDETGMDPVDVAVARMIVAGANAGDSPTDLSAFLFDRNGEPLPLPLVAASLIRFRVAVAGHSHLVGVGPR